VDLATVQKLLGHKDIATALPYIQSIPMLGTFEAGWRNRIERELILTRADFEPPLSATEALRPVPGPSVPTRGRVGDHSGATFSERRNRLMIN